MKTSRFKAWHSSVGEMFEPERLVSSGVYLSPDGSGFVGWDGVKNKFLEKLDWLIPIESTGFFCKEGEREFWDGDLIAMGLDEDENGEPFGLGMIAKKNGRWVCEFFDAQTGLNPDFFSWLDDVVFLGHALESAVYSEKFKEIA